jgi:colanic acid biosynthesis glycosyl transferase WcaI
MNIIILSHYFPPELGGGSARLYGFARWLTRLGHRVKVITGLPNYPTGRIPQPYRGKLWVAETIDGIDVLRTWVFAASYASPAARLANYLSFMIAGAIAGILAKGTYDIVLASSPPVFIGLAGWAVSRIRRIPYLFDIRDIWPEVMIEAGALGENSFTARLLSRAAAFSYRGANHLSVVTESKKNKLTQKGISPDKISVVTNGVDLDLIDVDTVDKRQEMGLTSKFVTVYAGLIGAAQGVSTLVEAAIQLRDDPGYHFIIIGDGVCRSELEQMVSENALDNVTLIPPLPRDQIPAYLQAADVCFVPLASSQIGDAVPSKLLEAWASRRAVLLVAGGEAARIVDEAGGGAVVAPEESQMIGKALSDLKEERERLDDMARRGFEYVEERYQRSHLTEQLAGVMETVIERAGKPRS